MEGRLVWSIRRESCLINFLSLERYPTIVWIIARRCRVLFFSWFESLISYFFIYLTSYDREAWCGGVA
jgi:hypothetical protein